MRIELPSTAWADGPHAQDDAHTLTLPAQAALHPALHPALLAAAPVDGEALPACAGGRVEVPAGRLPVLTLTF